MTTLFRQLDILSHISSTGGHINFKFSEVIRDLLDFLTLSLWPHLWKGEKGHENCIIYRTNSYPLLSHTIKGTTGEPIHVVANSSLLLLCRGVSCPMTLIAPLIMVRFLFPGSIFGILKGLSPDFGSRKTLTLGLTRDPPESQFPIINSDNVD